MENPALPASPAEEPDDRPRQVKLGELLVHPNDMTLVKERHRQALIKKVSRRLMWGITGGGVLAAATWGMIFGVSEAIEEQRKHDEAQRNAYPPMSFSQLYDTLRTQGCDAIGGVKLERVSLDFGTPLDDTNKKFVYRVSDPTVSVVIESFISSYPHRPPSLPMIVQDVDYGPPYIAPAHATVTARIEQDAAGQCLLIPASIMETS